MTGEQGFAVWITGMPASGKSSITRELVARLTGEGVSPAVLESDAMRMILTPEPTYDLEERDRFYLQLAGIGVLLVRQGIPVIFDATANRREYRHYARTRIARFVEVFVKCTIDICRDRDPKGLYAQALRGTATTVPGLQAVYEAPLAPDVTVDCRESSSVCADEVVAYLRAHRYI
jgi:adenylylsulfate kinase